MKVYIISLLISIKISRVGEIAIFFYVVDLYLIYVFYIKKYYIWNFKIQRI